jgi:hypothetical protein
LLYQRKLFKQKIYGKQPNRCVGVSGWVFFLFSFLPSFLPSFLQRSTPPWHREERRKEGRKEGRKKGSKGAGKKAREEVQKKRRKEELEERRKGGGKEGRKGGRTPMRLLATFMFLLLFIKWSHSPLLNRNCQLDLPSSDANIRILS